MPDSITIREVLKGTTPGYPQTVGYMTVIPLISELVDDRFTPPSLIRTGTRDYGALEVNNPNPSGIGILPTGTAIVTKQKAQNHTIGKPFPILAGKSSRATNAACIQDSQGGTIAMGEHYLSILPWVLREPMFMVKSRREYSKLWPALKEFNVSMGLPDRGHLELYLERFAKELDQFIAEFEVVAKQVGAIILIQGNVVGVERAPNYGYWRDIWVPLVREAYGSLVLYYRQKFGGNPPPPKTRVGLSTKNAENLNDISKALDRAEKKESENAREVVRDFIDEEFKVTKEPESKEVSGLTVNSLKNKQFMGQVVMDGDMVRYASLFTSAEYGRNKDWISAKPFEI